MRKIFSYAAPSAAQTVQSFQQPIASDVPEKWVSAASSVNSAVNPVPPICHAAASDRNAKVTVAVW